MDMSLFCRGFVAKSPRAIRRKEHEIKLSYKDITQELLKLETEGKIIVEEQRFYLPYLYYSEKGLVTSIQRFYNRLNMLKQFPESEFLLALGSLEERLSVHYAPSQKEAIQTALMSPLLILTGGPGQGKQL